jgi:hypothetical protein
MLTVALPTLCFRQDSQVTVTSWGHHCLSQNPLSPFSKKFYSALKSAFFGEAFVFEKKNELRESVWDLILYRDLIHQI